MVGLVTFDLRQLRDVVEVAKEPGFSRAGVTCTSSSGPCRTRSEWPTSQSLLFAALGLTVGRSLLGLIRIIAALGLAICVAVAVALCETL